ncbi:proline-rich protein 36-like [Portunus trituberculatus]|uniref:proline-rich protein 36-like n=1 Tax=Portunus trituberculatus TaxID=210409 RepID=UPI001E1D11C3|nr:proline-rich protein 36-like [Portunus trituberculatus]
MPHAKEGLGSGLPVVGSILAARRTAQHVACLQATRATLQQQHMQFTARCLVWWVAGVLLAVLQRLLWPRLRQPRVPRPAGPDVPERPQTGQSNLILYGAVSPQQVCAAMRCAWHYHMLMGLHRHLHRPHTKVLPSTTGLQHRLDPSSITDSAQGPAVFKCSAENFMPYVAAALSQTAIFPPSQRLLPIAASPPDMPHPLPVPSPTPISRPQESPPQTPPSKLSGHTPPYSDLPHPSPTLAPPLHQTFPPSCRTTHFVPTIQDVATNTGLPGPSVPDSSVPQTPIVPHVITTTTPVLLTNTGPHINTNLLTIHVHSIPTVPHTTHGPHTSRRHAQTTTTEAPLTVPTRLDTPATGTATPLTAPTHRAARLTGSPGTHSAIPAPARTTHKKAGDGPARGGTPLVPRVSEAASPHTAAMAP